MKLFALAIALASANSAFAAPITCQSNDENVGGGNIQITIGSPRRSTGAEGQPITVYPVTASNQNKRVKKQFDGSGTANANGISLTILTEGDIDSGYITVKAVRNTAGGYSLVGKTKINGVTGEEEISCWAAQ